MSINGNMEMLLTPGAHGRPNARQQRYDDLKRIITKLKLPSYVHVEHMKKLAMQIFGGVCIDERYDNIGHYTYTIGPDNETEASIHFITNDGVLNHAEILQKTNRDWEGYWKNDSKSIGRWLYSGHR